MNNCERNGRGAKSCTVLSEKYCWSGDPHIEIQLSPKCCLSVEVLRGISDTMNARLHNRNGEMYRNASKIGWFTALV
jgi:hypothetical protein